jgi:hypothetical protein
LPAAPLGSPTVPSSSTSSGSDQPPATDTGGTTNSPDTSSSQGKQSGGEALIEGNTATKNVLEGLGALPSTPTEQQPLASTPTVTEESFQAPKLPENYGADPQYTTYGDGSIVKTDEYGVSFTWFPNGTVTYHSETLTTKWTPVDSNSWIKKQSYTTGETYIREPDGTTTSYLSNGKASTYIPSSGVRIWKDPAPGEPGKFTVTTEQPDKTKTVKDPDGKETPTYHLPLCICVLYKL